MKKKNSMPGARRGKRYAKTKNEIEKDLKANRKYHDRVAARYDDIYTGNRWELWYDISWSGIKPYLPKNLRDPILDVGCGTGKYGILAARSGYSVTLSDLSPKMVDVARKKAEALNIADRIKCKTADVIDLSEFNNNHYQLVIAQGDVLSFAQNPINAMKEAAKKLKPGGILAGSVDQSIAAIDHYAEKLDLEGLEKLVCNQEMTWLAHDVQEQFPVHTFTVESLRESLEKAGFEVLDIFGKTVLPLKLLEPLLEDPKSFSRISSLEKKLCRKPSAMGKAAHLQFAARKP